MSPFEIPSGVFHRLAIATCLACGCIASAGAIPSDSTDKTAIPTGPSNTHAEFEPALPAASGDGKSAIQTFTVPDGFEIKLVAAEPLLANPVAFCFDNRGRLFVAETFRLGINRGVEDNTYHREWLDDDLAARTVADRLTYIKKYHGDQIATYKANSDRIRMLEDRNGDGIFEVASVFADGFNDILDGTGAGLIFHRNRLFYTCIPRLWVLQDKDGDCRADVRQSLHYGYGVHTSLMGHDLHGLCIGPDGKLYFSIGDRGYNIEHEGRTLADPDSGAVFRCNSDGSELEVFATGLRNPQELAFDQYGNLFTCDNNSDSGDKARWVYVVEGGDSGWRMAYQYLPDRGPFNRENIWYPQRPDQPAYIVPPVGHIADGPSGIVYYPGTGLPPRFDDHFFICDFRGTPNQSGIHSLAVQPKGAGFEIVDHDKFMWSILATDVDFGPDGGMYVCDWVESWNGVNKGRIYRLNNANAATKDHFGLDQTKELLAEGMESRTLANLADLLAHRNMKIRQAAQLELSDRGIPAASTLADVATNSNQQLTRIHALWALGQIGVERTGTLNSVFARLANDPDKEIRAQVARVLGWQATRQSTSFRVAASKLLTSEILEQDCGPRVHSLAAISLGKLGTASDAHALLDLLNRNDDRDAIVRHCASLGLSQLPLENKDLGELAADRSEAARMGVLLALRRRRAPEIEPFLNDPDPRLVEEAARAIYDLPIVTAMPKLAQVLDRQSVSSDPLLRRVLHANSRLGTPACAQRLAAFAIRKDASQAMRIEALTILADWPRALNRDPVLGMWRPREPHDVNVATRALGSVVLQLADAPAAVINQAFISANLLNIDDVVPIAEQVLNDKAQPSSSRASALFALERFSPEQIDGSVELALHDASAEVRSAARRVFARRNPQAAINELRSTIKEGELVERQSALSTLAEIESTSADALLASLLDQLLAGQWSADMELELLTAAEKRDDQLVQSRLKQYEAALDKTDSLSPYRGCLIGGDAQRGKRIFLERTEVACLRCHSIYPGEERTGPNLSSIGRDHDRRYLLGAIVEPNRDIARGFESTVVVLDSGKVVSGLVKFEDDDTLKMMDAEGKDIVVAKAEIEDRYNGQSAMPEDLYKSLSKNDLRDLVEFLAQQN